MTEPTQAQIDAAYDAAITFQKARKDTFVTKAMIAAALTAAAQVGEPNDKFAHDKKNSKVQQELVAATIERCAQLFDGPPAVLFNANVAAAIRTLATEEKR